MRTTVDEILVGCGLLGYERAAMPWLPVLLRGTRVLARCDASGALVADDGRVEVRYRPNDGKAYRALAANLGSVAGATPLPDAHCGEAAPVAKKTEGTSTKAAPAQTGAKKKTAAPGSAPKSREAPATAHPPLDAIIAYTDGACSGNPGPAGLGVVLLRDDSCTELSEYLGTGTNNIAELTAILRALERTESFDRELWVHTDSQYAIGVLSKGWKAKANQELIAATKRCMQGFRKLRLVYVKGHAGVPLNERADELARQAVSARATAGWRAGRES